MPVLKSELSRPILRVKSARDVTQIIYLTVCLRGAHRLTSCLDLLFDVRLSDSTDVNAAKVRIGLVKRRLAHGRGVCGRFSEHTPQEASATDAQ